MEKAVEALLDKADQGQNDIVSLKGAVGDLQTSEATNVAQIDFLKNRVG